MEPQSSSSENLIDEQLWKLGNYCAAQGAPAVAICAEDGVVLAVEKIIESRLVIGSTIRHIEALAMNMAVTFAGIQGDFRMLAKLARREVLKNHLFHEKNMMVLELAKDISSFMQETAESETSRCFGVGLLLGGWETEGSCLYQFDARGIFARKKASVVGKNADERMSFLRNHYYESIKLDTATCIVLQAIQLDRQLGAQDFEIGICTKNGFNRLNKQVVHTYLNNMR